MKLARVIETCSACPSQWNAWTVDGQYLYMRYRSGIGTVDAFPSPDPDTWKGFAEGTLARFDTGDRLDGCMELADFLAATGLELAVGAQVSE